MGGVNYYCNLFQALTNVSDSNFDLLAIVGTKTPLDIIALYEQFNVKVIKVSVLDRFSFEWFIDRASWALFGKRFILDAILKRYKVNLISHVQCDMGVSCRQVGWVPDFQHLHLPQMFSKDEIKNRDKSFMSVASKADVVILSSYDALNDFSSFSPEFFSKGRVAQFVSQPPSFYSELSEKEYSDLVDKYSIDRPYIYVPNQFWRHKNHQLLLEAIFKSKQQGVSPLVLCSGLMEDYRDSSYVDSLIKYVKNNDLSDNVKFLGLIPYKDVFSLIKFSLLVLNPSKFEGWSSTVEECKSVGKMMILSDISVHKEQYPQANFFNVNSSDSLANVIAKAVRGELSEHSASIKSVEERTQDYASVCMEIYSTVVNGPSM
ncbi:glycosyltransferase family 1 protein [Rheinheimera tangshanensis]|nr:glycosyl transferase [Rheinheimera tangshanensis]